MTVRLVECSRGDLVRVVRIDASRGASLNLMNLGISVGQTIELLQSSPLRGPLLVARGDTEVAVGYHLAEKILVEKD